MCVPEEVPERKKMRRAENKMRNFDVMEKSWFKRFAQITQIYVKYCRLLNFPYFVDDFIIIKLD